MGKIKNPILIRLALWFEGILYRHAKSVVTCSEGQNENIQKRYPLIHCETIPHGGDLELFGSSDIHPVPLNGKILFTHTGSLGLIHHCKLILDAALYIKLHHPAHNLRIAFIGEGAEKEALQKQAKTNELDFVEFYKLMPKQDLPPWIKASRATLFTTLNNEVQNTSCPNKIFDSFAAGIPIIQTTTGWIKKLIEEEHCGINVEPDSPESLAKAMLNLAEDDNQFEEMSRNALRLAYDQFNRDNLSKKYEGIIMSSIS